MTHPNSTVQPILFNNPVLSQKKVSSETLKNFNENTDEQDSQ